MHEKSRLRRAISAWADSGDQHSRQLRKEYSETRGGTSIADSPDRTMVELQGTIRTVTLRPRGGVPALEAELYDGSAALILVWLGRRRITGINPGRAISVSGRIGVHDKVRIMYNPRYQLLP